MYIIYIIFMKYLINNFAVLHFAILNPFFQRKKSFERDIIVEKSSKCTQNSKCLTQSTQFMLNLVRLKSRALWTCSNFRAKRVMRMCPLSVCTFPENCTRIQKMHFNILAHRESFWIWQTINFLFSSQMIWLKAWAQ